MATNVTLAPELPTGPKKIDLKFGNYILTYPDGEVRIVFPIKGSVVIISPTGSTREVIMRNARSYRERGSVLLEFALTVPIVFLIVLSSLDLCWDATAKSNLNWITTQSASCTKNPSCDPVVLAQDNASGLTMRQSDLTVAVNGSTVTCTYQAHGLVGFLPPITLTSSAAAQ